MNGSEILGVVILVLALAALCVAVWRRGEGGVLVAVAGYVGVTLYFIERQPHLLAAALTLPIAVAMVGLTRVLSERTAL